MKSTMWKSTFREVKMSFGRFFAIMAIIALGVSFFAGLKVAKTAMVRTTQYYLEENAFYDFRLLSTMGFEKKDVDFFQSQEEVKAAEGSITFDILCRNETGNEMVVKAHSLTEKVNGVKLVDGRMPENKNECVADSNLFTASQIGEKLVLSQDNEEEDLEHFIDREYTIVGLVQSSSYIQFERGNTSLGNGRVAGFIYLLQESFDVDYFTEIYVKFDKEFPLYSEEYDNYIEGKNAQWEVLAEFAAASRRDSLLADAREELADARKELEDKKSDAQKELADARKELEEAQEELSDGRRKLEDAQKELADGRKTLEDKKAEILEAQEKLTEEEQKLADGEKEVQDGLKNWEEQNQIVESAKAKLNAKEQELESQAVALEVAASELASSEAQLQVREEETAGIALELEQQENLLNQQQKELEDQEARINGQEELVNQQEEALNAQEKELLDQFGIVPEEAAAQIVRGRQEITAYREQIKAGRKQLETGKAQLNAYQEQLNAGKEQLAAGREQLASARAQLEAGKLELEKGRELIADYRRQAEDGRTQLEDADKQLAAGWMQLQEGQTTVVNGRKQLEDARQELADGQKQLEDAEKELQEGAKELAGKKQEFENGKAEYEEGLQDYQKAASDFDSEVVDAEKKLADAEREIADVEEPDTYVLGRDTNVGYVLFENDSSIVEGIANIFPIFFFSVAALVCITTMNRMVEEQRTQIGVLKALGYGEGRIMTKYLFYSGSAAAAGCVAGFFGGTWLFPNVIWNAYGMMYQVDSLIYVFDWKLAVISLTVSLACSIGTTWLSCRYELFEAAAQLMRPKSPKAGKRVFLEKVPFIWKHLKFLHKVSFRNIFRYKKRFFMMVAGISGCTALLVTGFGIKDSIANVAGQQFDEIQIYDVSVNFTDPVTESVQQELMQAVGEQVQELLPVLEKTMDLEAGNQMKSVNLVVSQSDADITPFLNLHTTQEKPLSFPGDGEAVLSHKLAETYGIKVGDIIVLRNDSMKTIMATVTGVNENYIYNYVYINENTYQNQTGNAPEYKTIYVNMKEGTNAHQFSAELMKLDTVSNVTVNEDTKERFNSMMKSLDLIVLVVILCAAGLAFIVLYNLTNINITERVREIATIKVLGFYKKETASYVFRENIILTLIGTAVGLILGHYLHLFVMNEINIDMVAFAVVVKPFSFLYSVLLTFAFAWFVNFIMRGKLEKISMTESLKSVD